MQSVTSTAAQVIVTIIPIVGIVMGSTLIFFYLLYSHRQKMKMIEKGLISQKSLFDIDSFSLFSGLLLLGIGLSLTLFFLIKEGSGFGVLSGIIPLSGGISLLLFFWIRMSVLNPNE